MSNSIVALRYVKSLLHMAIEQGVLEEVHNDMILLDKLIRENRPLSIMLKNPVVSHQKKLNVLSLIFKDKVSGLTMSMFEIISKKNREHILADMASVFHEQYNLYKGITEATVITQYPIDNTERKTFKEIVKKNTGAREVELNEKIDHDLIGGFVLQIGDKQIDNSLRSKLAKLKIKFES